jgi:hypothetical protein
MVANVEGAMFTEEHSFTTLIVQGVAQGGSAIGEGTVMSAVQINAKRAAEWTQEGQSDVSSVCARMIPMASTQVSSKLKCDALASGDAAMAEATAHLVSAYRALEDVALASSPFAGSEHFRTAARSLYTALLALDECCLDIWTVPA